MTRDEWNQVLATEPATSNQLGAIMREFTRLGFGDADRAERLAVCAELLELDELGSSGDLTMGQAGMLVNVLQHTRTAAELADITAAPDDPHDQAAEPDFGDADEDRTGSERVTWPEAIARIAAVIYTAYQGNASAGRGGPY